jgi:hypothetical protein
VARVRPVTVATGRTPFEVTMFAAALLAGLALLVVDTRPASVQLGMLPTVQVIWEFGLIVAGLAGLVGVGRRWPVLSTGLIVEMLGVCVLGSVTSMYGTALFVISGTQALAAGSFVVAVAAGSWWRMAQIILDLKRAGRAAQARTTAAFELLAERLDE